MVCGTTLKRIAADIRTVQGMACKPMRIRFKEIQHIETFILNTMERKTEIYWGEGRKKKKEVGG